MRYKKRLNFKSWCWDGEKTKPKDRETKTLYSKHWNAPAQSSFLNLILFFFFGRCWQPLQLRDLNWQQLPRMAIRIGGAGDCWLLPTRTNRFFVYCTLVNFQCRIFLGAYGRKCKLDWLYVRKSKMRRCESRLCNRKSWTVLNSTSCLRTQWKSIFSRLSTSQAVVMKTKLVGGRGRKIFMIKYEDLFCVCNQWLKTFPGKVEIFLADFVWVKEFGAERIFLEFCMQRILGKSDLGSWMFVFFGPVVA